jgi:hypothetical protein
VLLKVVNLVRATGHYLVTGLTVIGQSAGPVYLPVVGWAPAPGYGLPKQPHEPHVSTAAPALMVEAPALASADLG